MAKPHVPYNGPIVTYAEAVAGGLKRYFIGSVCRRAGHLSERNLNGNCIACVLISTLAWKKANPAKANANQRRYNKAHPERLHANYLANKDKLRAQRRARRQANPEASRAEVRKWFAAHPGVVQRWRKANPEAYRAQVQTRHAREANAEGSHTGADLEALLKQQNGRCGYCRKSIKTTWTVDHIQPLSKGGTNWISNIQLLCPSCNYSKQDADPLEFARRLGRLV